MIMGITILHPTTPQTQHSPSPSITLDIIALHGLNGSQTRTWTHPDTSTLWLRDFLPSDLPTARIMTFGYDATAAFANSTAGIVEHARDFLGCLVAVREEDGGKRRKLIMMGHSLGGLVIKQALVIASQEPTRYPDIYSSLLGIIFFGTPHRGSALANFAATLIRIPTMLAMKPSPELLNTLSKGGKQIEILSKNFARLHAEREFEIVSFYETRCLQAMKELVVPKESSLLTAPNTIPTWEEQIPVNSNHREMCRFATNKDQTYKAAVRSIKRLRMGVVPQLENEQFLVPHNSSLYFTGREDVRGLMREALVEDMYDKKDVQMRFVLYGLGGAGKTQVCLKFAEEFRERYRYVFWIEASSKETIEKSFAKISTACKLEKAIEAARSWLSEKEHWLLIFDNADDPTLDLAPFIPGGSRGTVLITSRNPGLKKWGTVGSYRVDEMSADDAVSLLLKTSLLAQNTVDERTTETAGEVVKTLNYFALAIIQAGAVIRQDICNLDGFLDLYAKHRKDLIESAENDQYQYSVYTTWEISIKQIEKMSDVHAVLALELLSLFAYMHFDGIREEIFQAARENFVSNPASEMGDGPYGESLLVELMTEGWDGLLMARALVLLVGFSLITLDGSRNISMHPLVHEWSRERPSESVQIKYCKIVMAMLTSSTTLGEAFSDHQHRRMLFPHMTACMARSTSRLQQENDYQIVRLRLIRKILGAFMEAHQWEKVLELSREDLKIQETKFPQEKTYSYTWQCIGDALFNLGQYEESRRAYKSSLQEVHEARDPALIVAALNGLARNDLVLSYHSPEHTQKVIESCNKMLKEFEDDLDKDHPACLYTMDIIAMAYSNLGQPRAAVEYSEKAFEGRKRTYGNHHIWTVQAGESLADNYTDLKMFKRARELLTQNLTLLEQTVGADHPLTAIAMIKLADLPRRENRRPIGRRKGFKLRKEALDRSREVLGETHTWTLCCLEHLSDDYFLCGSLQKSKLLHEELVKKSTDKWGEESVVTIRAKENLALISRGIATRKAIYWWVPKKLLDRYSA